MLLVRGHELGLHASFTHMSTAASNACEVQQRWLSRMVGQAENLYNGMPRESEDTDAYCEELDLPEHLVPSAEASEYTAKVRALASFSLRFKRGGSVTSPTPARRTAELERSQSLRGPSADVRPLARSLSDAGRSGATSPRSSSPRRSTSMSLKGPLAYRVARSRKDSSRYAPDSSAADEATGEPTHELSTELSDGTVEGAPTDGGGLHPALGRARGLDVVQAHQLAIREEQSARVKGLLSL